jgi:hypothetical protein
MGRLGKWIAGAAGGLAVYRWFRGRPQPVLEPPPEPEAGEPDARADELRAKLAESRAEAPEEPAADTESPEERRRRVHEEGRAALDEMSPGSDG